MRKTLLMLAGVLAAAMVGTPVAATSVDTDPDSSITWPGSQANHAGYWEARWPGATCRKLENGSDQGVFTLRPDGAFRLVIKQGQMDFIWKWPEAGQYAGPYSQPGGKGGPGWSHAFICYKQQPPPPPPPKPEPKVPQAKVVSKGPAGDPFYRHVFKNTGETRATCKVTFLGRDGWRTYKRRLAPGQGYRTPWMWVQGNTKVRQACWSQGERIYYRAFTSAPPGFYRPLWQGYRVGYFDI